MTAPPPYRQRNIFPLIIRLSVGLALLAFLFGRYADLGQVWELIRQSDLRLLLLALFIAICGEVLTAYKWRRLVDFIGGHLPVLPAVRASFIGMFYNNFLPGSVGGDIVRILLIARYAGGKARATASAFMQRNTGLAGLFLIGIPAAYLWPRHIDWPGKSLGGTGTRWLTDALTWLVAAAAGYSITNMLFFSTTAYNVIWRNRLQQVHNDSQGRLISVSRYILGKLQRFHEELHGYRFWLVIPLLISAVTQLVDIFLVYTLSQALGLEVPFTVLLVAVPMVTLANLAPVTVNGIGLRETVYIAMLHNAGISATSAIALSLSHFAVITALAASGGILHALSPREASANGGLK